MKAIQSLWTKTPEFRLSRTGAILFSASAAYLNRAFEQTELVTDHDGMRIAQRLGWDYVTYSLALEPAFCPTFARHVWALGKIEAQAAQNLPHIHIDLDLLFFNPPPRRVRGARVVVQSVDELAGYKDGRRPAIMEACGVLNGTAPLNCGVIGWNDLALRDAYCARAREVAHKAAKLTGDGTTASIVAEQAVLGALLRERGVRAETLIPMASMSDRCDFEDIQFVHVWAETKNKEEWQNRVATRFEQDFPQKYRDALRGFDLLVRAGLAFHE